MNLFCKKLEPIDKVISISCILLFSLGFSTKDCSYSDKIMIILLLIMSLKALQIKNSKVIGEFIHGQQYEIMCDIRKIKNEYKDKSIEEIGDIISEYYEKNTYSTEQYLSRHYKVDTEYQQWENIKYGFLVWVITFFATEFFNELSGTSKGKKGFLYYITTCFGRMILVMVILVLFISIMDFFYFRPSKKNVLDKFISDKEKEILNKKIEELT